MAVFDIFATVGLAFLIAHLSYALIEKPGIALGSGPPRSGLPAEWWGWWRDQTVTETLSAQLRRFAAIGCDTISDRAEFLAGRQS